MLIHYPQNCSKLHIFLDLGGRSQCWRSWSINRSWRHFAEWHQQYHSLHILRHSYWWWQWGSCSGPLRERCRKWWIFFILSWPLTSCLWMACKENNEKVRQKRRKKYRKSLRHLSRINWMKSLKKQQLVRFRIIKGMLPFMIPSWTQNKCSPSTSAFGKISLCCHSGYIHPSFLRYFFCVLRKIIFRN